jgi:hypothetical protein
MLKEMKYQKGVIGLAVGHPYYGRLIYNLFCSVKAAEPEMPVAVIHGGRALSHLSMQQMSIFDEVIELPENIKGGFSAKLYLNELTPFKETLFFDADMLWLPAKTPSQLFNELSEVDFTGITEGWCDIETLNCDNANQAYYFWADVKEIKEVYKLSEGKLYQWRSEVMYFKKNARTDKFFRKAQSINKNPRLKTVKNFGEHLPDELSINISAAVHGINPHKDKWTPAYWYKLNNDQIPHATDMNSKWYLVSFGSHYSSGTIKRLYDTITKVAMKKLGRAHVFGLHSKRDYLPERAKM